MVLRDLGGFLLPRPLHVVTIVCGCARPPCAVGAAPLGLLSVTRIFLVRFFVRPQTCTFVDFALIWRKRLEDRCSLLGLTNQSGGHQGVQVDGHRHGHKGRGKGMCTADVQASTSPRRDPPPLLWLALPSWPTPNRRVRFHFRSGRGAPPQIPSPSPLDPLPPVPLPSKSAEILGFGKVFQ